MLDNIDKCLLSLSQIFMQGKWLKCTETMSRLCNGLAHMLMEQWLSLSFYRVNSKNTHHIFQRKTAKNKDGSRIYCKNLWFQSVCVMLGITDIYLNIFITPSFLWKMVLSGEKKKKKLGPIFPQILDLPLLTTIQYVTFTYVEKWIVKKAYTRGLHQIYKMMLGTFFIVGATV